MSLDPEKVRELTVAVLILHNWLRSGQPKTVYMTRGFCDHMIRQLNHSFPVAGGKKIITIA